MAQNLTPVRQPPPSLTADPATAHAAESLYRRVTWQGNVAVLDAPVPNRQREALKSRLVECRRALMPVNSISDRAKIGLALSRLFQGYAHTGSASPESSIAAYVAKLEELPMWAVEAAIADLARGRVEGMSPDFPPSAARIFQLAEAKMGDVKTEQRRIEVVLNARVAEEPARHPDEVRRVAESMKTFAAEMAAKNPTESEEATRERRERDQRNKERNDAALVIEYHMHGFEPVMFNGRPMSMSLARATGARLIPRMKAPVPKCEFSQEPADGT